jgi:excinuclease ABC subunit C
MPRTLHPPESPLAAKLESLPAKPGVYQFRSEDGTTLYVGKSQNLRARVRQYFQPSRSPDPRLDAMVAKVRDLEVIVTDSDVEALILESNLIKQLKPRYNVILKDDKSYPYIVITNEPFPRIFVTRRIIKDGSRYFGPYTDVKGLRLALKTIRESFRIRSCNYDLTPENIRRKRFKLCLDYHIKKCEGPCEGLETEEHYARTIEQVAAILRGKTSVVAAQLEAEMRQLSEALRFEDAAAVRDRLQSLRVYSEKQKMVDAREADRDIIGVAQLDDDSCGVILKVREGKVLGARHYSMRNTEGMPVPEILEALVQRFYLDIDDIPPEIVLPEPIPSDTLVRQWLKTRQGTDVKFTVAKGGELGKLAAMVRANARFLLDELRLQRKKRGEEVPFSLMALQRDLRLPAPPRRIECFDVSNIQGSDTVASMVVFVDGKPRKQEYRKFAIRSVVGPDDFASMREVVERRYRRLREEEGTPPDLIVIDGGKGQLSSAREALESVGLPEVATIGLAKRLEEVFVPGESEPLAIPRTSAGLKLLQQIRNEAHRFAVAYHRQKRSKRLLRTELDLIKGVGRARARELLEAFGSVQGVRFASEEQLSEIVGSKVASDIKTFFEHPSDDEVQGQDG